VQTYTCVTARVQPLSIVQSMPDTTKLQGKIKKIFKYLVL
jgi:hypothetical protein